MHHTDAHREKEWTQTHGTYLRDYEAALCMKTPFLLAYLSVPLLYAVISLKGIGSIYSSRSLYESIRT